MSDALFDVTPTAGTINIRDDAHTPPLGPPLLTVLVRGVPAPQGSHRAFVVGNRAVITQDNKKTRPWRQSVQYAAVEALNGQPPTRHPVHVDVTFALPRPRSHYRTGRNAHLLRDAAPAWPAGKPDVDKLLRACLDSLSDAGVWIDDAQVVDLVARKRYAGPGELLLVPGALIVISEMR